MEIDSYTKILHFGSKYLGPEFEHGTFVVQEKIDGSQVSFGKIDGKIYLRSKNRMVPEDDPHMFDKAWETVRGLESHLPEGVVFRGEYLRSPKHNALQYDRVPEGHIIVWERGRYKLPCLEYVPEGGFIGTAEDALAHAKEIFAESILGGCAPEGIVLKRYDLKDRDGRPILAAKWVRPDFREVNNKLWNRGKSKDVCEDIGRALGTPARYAKAVQAMRDEGVLDESLKDIGELIERVRADILAEHEQDIKDKLFQQYSKAVLKVAAGGVPEWYKRELGFIS